MFTLAAVRLAFSVILRVHLRLGCIEVAGSVTGAGCLDVAGFVADVGVAGVGAIAAVSGVGGGVVVVIGVGSGIGDIDCGGGNVSSWLSTQLLSDTTSTASSHVGIGLGDACAIDIGVDSSEVGMVGSVSFDVSGDD